MRKAPENDAFLTQLDRTVSARLGLLCSQNVRSPGGRWLLSCRLVSCRCSRYRRAVRGDAPRIESLPAGVRRLIADGHAVPASRDLGEVLSEIERPVGDVTAEGTRALEEQRGTPA